MSATSVGVSAPPTVAELERVVASQADEIRRLRASIGERDDEIGELRSQLDKYKSVLSLRSDGFLSSPTSRSSNGGAHGRLSSGGTSLLAGAFDATPPVRRDRLIGISAEPPRMGYDQLTLADTVVTPFPKDDKYVPLSVSCYFLRKQTMKEYFSFHVVR